MDEHTPKHTQNQTQNHTLGHKNRPDKSNSAQQHNEGEHTSILILGAGVMQLPALRWAQKQGWKVYVADGNPSAPGVGFADHFIPVDLTDIEGMISAARKIQRSEGLHGVFTAGTDFSYTVARVAEALELPGVRPEVALNASHKHRMRSVFAKNGVPSPRFAELSPEDNINPALEELDLPLVVKPVDNMGARGIRRVDTLSEYARAVYEARRFSRTGTVIVEEYVPGPEFSIDALVIEGEIHFTGIADRHIYFPPYFIEMGHTIPTKYNGKIVEAIKSAFSEAVRALDIRTGAAKGDVKWDGHRAVIGEIAARLSGGYMSGWTFPYASGVELTGSALRLSVGKPPLRLAPSKHWVSAERAFISIPGIVESVEQAEQARDRQWIEEMFVRVGPGDEVSFPTNNVEKSGNFISAAPGRQTAASAAEEACRTVFVRLRPNEPRTFRYLFREKEEWIPDAFQLESGKNIEAYNAMELIKDNRKNYTDDQNSRTPEIAIDPLPFISEEKSVDWHGTPFSEGWKKVLELSGATVADGKKSADIIIGTVFWTAFLRGGIQGAVWIIDSIRHLSEGPQPIESVFEELDRYVPNV